MAPSADASPRHAADTRGMHVIHHAHLSRPADDGEQRFPVAGRSCGINAFEVWMHTLSPGAESADQRHHGELAAIALAGSGKLLIDGGPQRFHSPCTLVIPAGCEFRIVNNASVPLQFVVVCTEAAEDIRSGSA
jgi:quercetin dioxygenase-like cupin family protein